MASINDLATAAIASSSSPKSAAEGAPAAAAAAAAASGTKRGAFIVLEGLDRSGKTTQAKLLEQRFVEEGRPVKLMRFPDRTTPIGVMIDGYLKSDVEMEDHVIHLLFSANRWEAANQIHTLLAAGTTIVCDRFYHSGIVYSAAKQNPTLGAAWARAPERGLPRPDMVLFLDLDEEQARARGGWGGEVYERAETQRRVKELFWALSRGARHERHGLLLGEAATAPGGGGDGGSALAWKQEEEDLVVVDAGASVEEVAEDVWARVEGRVRQVERGEAGRTVRVVV
ncbi:thymidylate kinase domain-containing protein [Hirsutella rhossiliensis]|uniref:Thymidylate kinase n=1 Tax=Hirsutella rhossiliensis TaxID=111463 RepID=A0A9P8MQA8_9HYPO|nr:thymidylate kinase domain-containing protein [Hirsutella rhossiliensis]KAH0958226.1 thymidylate kinase domain-containing protein [Hirsutella rhossiliensis]